MKKLKRIVIISCLLIIVLGLTLGGGVLRGWLTDELANITAWLQPEVPGYSLGQLTVYGESLHISAFGDPAGEPYLYTGTGDDRQQLPLNQADEADKGLKLYTLSPGLYELWWGELPLKPQGVWQAEGALPEGWTLPRDGQRLHWQFAADRRGVLTLLVETAETLPADRYDVILDPGHGGDDGGAEGVFLGQTCSEAEENLAYARLLKELLEQRGLKVALSRYDEAIPGGAAAEFNPYARGARVEQIYNSRACYLLSCHLNAGFGFDAGFQVYTSVLTSRDFASAVADRLREAGAVSNEEGIGRTAPGIYQREDEQAQVLRDYYFILRETGGYALSPAHFLIGHRDYRQQLAAGPQGLLLELAFIDNPDDFARWRENREVWLAAVAEGCADYWQLSE